MSDAADRNRLREALRQVSRQCGDVIFFREGQPGTNAEHLKSWEALKLYVDRQLEEKEGGDK